MAMSCPGYDMPVPGSPSVLDTGIVYVYMRNPSSGQFEFVYPAFDTSAAACALPAWDAWLVLPPAFPYLHGSTLSAYPAVALDDALGSTTSSLALLDNTLVIGS